MSSNDPINADSWPEDWRELSPGYPPPAQYPENYKAEHGAPEFEDWGSSEPDRSYQEENSVIKIAAAIIVILLVVLVCSGIIVAIIKLWSLT